MAPRNVCWRCGKSRAPPVNSCSRLASRVRMEAGESTLTRAPRARSRAQTIQPGTNLSDGRRVFAGQLKIWFGATARCTNSATAGYCDKTSIGGFERVSGSSSGGTGYSCSPYTCSAARLVTRILRLEPIASSSARSAPRAAVARNCPDQQRGFAQ